MATISEQLTQLASIKSDIKDAIEAKGETVGDDAFSTYATHIGNISSGGGGGGFRCTNKQLGNGEILWSTWADDYQYTFEGTLQEAGIGILNGDPLQVTGLPNTDVSYSTLNFQDVHSAHAGITYEGHDRASVISPSLTFSDGSYYNVTVSISNTGLLTCTQNISGDQLWCGLNLIIFFRGTDNTIDFDIVSLYALGAMD